MAELGEAPAAAEERCYGKYRAFAADVEDPEKLGRIRLRIPSLLGDQITDWALPCLPFGGGPGYGWFAIPEKEAQLWAEFEEGDLSRPLWTGAFWQTGGDVPEGAGKSPPTTRLLQTPGGHLLQFDDEKDKERFLLRHPAGAEIQIDEKGSVTVTDAAGAKVTLDADGKKVVVEDSNGNSVLFDSAGIKVADANGNEVEMAASGVTVKGQQVVIQGSQVALGGQGGEQLLKGTTFLSLFNAHVHNCTAPGSPSGPPIPPLTPAVLTTKVTAS